VATSVLGAEGWPTVHFLGGYSSLSVTRTADTNISPRSSVYVVGDRPNPEDEPVTMTSGKARGCTGEVAHDLLNQTR
jgi:hypothetical protein